MKKTAERERAKAKGTVPEELYGQYLSLLMEAVRLKATTKKNANVLHHLKQQVYLAPHPVELKLRNHA